MRRKRAIGFLWMLLAACLLRSGAGAAQFGDFGYTSDGTSITITAYFGPGGAVVIPGTITNLPVTTISGSAFLFSVFNVTSVAFPDSLTTIGSGAFEHSALSNVTLSSNLASVGENAFARCLSLTNITADIANTEYSSIDGVLFNKAQTTLVQCPGAKSGNYVIPGSVTTIGESAFADCRNLTDVTIPDSIINIEGGAFHQAGLTSVMIPNSVISIGAGAFSSCTGLTSVAIGSGANTIGHGAFIYCQRLTNITVAISNANFTASDGVLIDSVRSTIIQCPGGKAGSYVVPDNITDIGLQAFDSCTNLTSVVIGNSVTNIGSQGFSYCYSLTSVSIPGSVISIGHSAFAGCFNLVRVTIPDSVTTIGSSMFEYCSSLTNLYFAGNAPPPYNNVFEKTTNVTVYYLPGSSGWSTNYCGRPAGLWNPEFTAANIAGGTISCVVTGTPNIPIAFEASTNLIAPEWIRLLTTNLTAGSLNLQDPSATTNSIRFYRIAGPP